MNKPAFVFPVPCTKPGPEGKVIESIGIYRFLKIHVEQTVQQTFIDFTPPSRCLWIPPTHSCQQESLQRPFPPGETGPSSLQV